MMYQPGDCLELQILRHGPPTYKRVQVTAVRADGSMSVRAGKQVFTLSRRADSLRSAAVRYDVGEITVVRCRRRR